MSTNSDEFDRAIAAWNAGDLTTYLELYDDTIQLHGYSDVPMDKAEAAAFYGSLFASLDDIHLEIHQVVEADDRLAVHATMSGTHVGELFGVPGTGTRINQGVMTILRMADGRCVERWSVADTLGVMMQLGAIPAPA